MSSTGARQRDDDSTSSMIAYSVALFAAAMLAVVGVVQVLEGISAVAKDSIYVAGVKYSYEIDVTTWGWIHIVIGAVAVAAAVGLFLDQSWGRIAGIAIAALGAIANFAFVPYYPIWSLVVIAFYGIVIWALAYQLRD
jgi:hypothetical protein